MNSKKAKAIRKLLRENGTDVGDGGAGRKEYRLAKREYAQQPVVNTAKPLPKTHSHRTAEARAHLALPKSERNAPWREHAALIEAKHPQRERRSGKKHGNGLNMTPAEVSMLLRLQGFGKFAGAFLAGAARAVAGVTSRYQKRASRGR